MIAANPAALVPSQREVARRLRSTPGQGPQLLIALTGYGQATDRAAALDAGHLAGYGADVLDEEPPPANHPLLRCRNAVITPHIGSRTHESVVRQATMAAQNMINILEGRPALAQANKLS